MKVRMPSKGITSQMNLMDKKRIPRPWRRFCVIGGSIRLTEPNLDGPWQKISSGNLVPICPAAHINSKPK